jgi:hypothetical protein
MSIDTHTLAAQTDDDTCDLDNCGLPVDGAPSWHLPDGDELYLCSPHHNEPSHLKPEAVAVYWEKIAAGEPAPDAQNAAYAALSEEAQRWYRGELTQDAGRADVD